MEECDRRSRLTGKHYNLFSDDIIRIVNMQQAMAYMENDVMPVDIYPSEKDGKRILVFLFNREETRDVYDLWCKHEL